MYEVIVTEYHNHEFGFSLYAGDVFQHEDVEPDLIADLLSRGIVRDRTEREPKPTLQAKQKGENE